MAILGSGDRRGGEHEDDAHERGERDDDEAELERDLHFFEILHSFSLWSRPAKQDPRDSVQQWDFSRNSYA